MKFTYSWLKDHLETSASLEEIGTALTNLGLEVEEIQDKSASFKPFVIARIEKTEPHPNADRLKVCTVNTGSETLQVVCGAPNARAGLVGVFAPVGTYIPGLDLTLKKAKIRDVESNGMMASEAELQLSDDHDGIIDLPEDAPVGTSYADYAGLGDPVIEIGLTPNRADCAGVRGIARDLAATGLGTLKPLEIKHVQGNFKTPINVHFDSQKAKDACPLFLGCAVKGVKNGPSPEWMQKRLKAIGLRPISALVDITNYLSYDLCRPLHAFDTDKLQGDLHARMSKKGETLNALNKKTYTLEDDMAVISDDSGVIDLLGIMGDVPTGCTPETQNVLIECAYFDPIHIAKTGRALQINSDARYRFERGIDPEFTMEAIHLATQLVIDVCGGEPSEILEIGAVPEWQRSITFDPALTLQLTGMAIGLADQARILQDLGFKVEKKSENEWAVQPPAWRGDIEGKADLVEEIGRVYGYDHLPLESVYSFEKRTRTTETSSYMKGRKARNTLAARGLQEVVSWSFMDSKAVPHFGSVQKALTLISPISEELDHMRPSILPNLIQMAVTNHNRGFANSSFSEVGPIYTSGDLVKGQERVAAGVRAGATQERHWSNGGKTEPITLYDVKADVYATLNSIGFDAANLQISTDVPGYYHPGQSGCLSMGKNIIAYFGMIHPAILENLDADEPIAGFEIFLDRVPDQKKKAAGIKPLQLSPLQPVHRDFAFVVEANLPANDLIRAVKGADKTLIEDVAIFDVYEGQHIEDGYKSIALAVTLQPRDETLTDEALEAISQKIIDSAAKHTGAKLRA